LPRQVRCAPGRHNCSRQAKRRTRYASPMHYCLSAAPARARSAQSERVEATQLDRPARIFRPFSRRLGACATMRCSHDYGALTTWLCLTT
jgi:hypothetical protein